MTAAESFDPGINANASSFPMEDRNQTLVGMSGFLSSVKGVIQHILKHKAVMLASQGRCMTS